jgi:hypothetical protein
MIPLRTKEAFLATGALCAAGLILWPGCATPPLRPVRAPISTFKPADFSFGKGAHPTHDELIAKLGQPDEYFSDLRVACYELNDIKRRRLILLFGILPIGVYKDENGVEVAMIQFDDHDREQRTRVKIFSGYYDKQRILYSEAQKWVTKPASYRLNTETQPRQPNAR